MPFKLQKTINRRDFLKASSAIAAFSILPSGLRANSPNGRLQVVQVGVGGRGVPNLQGLTRIPHLDLVGICDVDSSILDQTATQYPKAKAFKDYREMFSQLDKKIDGVLISTPDHMHAPISIDAMNQGKHVYCEKPLAHSVGENRQLAALAAKTKRVTQLGIQLSSSQAQRMTIELIRSGVIGKVSEVHVWSFKSWGSDKTALPEDNPAVPETLDWNLWQGVCQTRPYKDDTYHPGQWRSQIDFGTGTLGDMGVHIFHTPFRALDLKDPFSVQAECRNFNGVYHPSKTVVEYNFTPTNYTADTFKWTWYDGAFAPPKSFKNFDIPTDYQMPNQGCLFIGEKGSLILPHGSGPQTFPRELIRSVPKPKLPRIDHHQNWVDACLNGGETMAPFSYGGPLTEMLQLGVIGMRYPGKTLNWNAEKMRIANLRKANQFLNRKYRKF